jgi:hypothetical protein
MNEENTNQTIYHEECLALTIRKEYRLTALHNLFCIASRVSFKVSFSVVFLTLLNSFI